MRPGGRLAAAIEVLEEVQGRHRPVSVALADWGKAHRFAGSGDRAAIGNLVYDVLRQRASLAWRMNSETPRALAIGAMAFGWGETAESLGAMFSGDTHAPAPLSNEEVTALSSNTLDAAPEWVQADIPEWLMPAVKENFEEEVVVEGRALAQRPSTDFRVNTLKSDPEKAANALKRFSLERTPLSPWGLRHPPTQGAARTPNLTPEAAFQKGWVEVQDEGSQVCAALVFAHAGEQVLDYCAGAGGKTMALSAAMQNKGQIFAYDSERTRLAPIYDRIKRAGTRNVQVRAPGDDLDDLAGRMDRVVVDAPCTGSGVWRRRPDAKWRVTPEALEKRLKEQQTALDEACRFVRPGGYLCYVTCSILPQENEGSVYGFLERNGDFELISAGEVWESLFAASNLKPWSSDECTITMTPATTGTDGFFFAVMERVSDE